MTCRRRCARRARRRDAVTQNIAGVLGSILALEVGGVADAPRALAQPPASASQPSGAATQPLTPSGGAPSEVAIPAGAEGSGGGARPSAPGGEVTQDGAIAEDLFQRGMEALDAGDDATACDLLEQSLRLEVAPGTLWQLSQCRERLGQLASAWAAARRLEGLSRRRGEDQRASLAQQRAEELEPRLARVVFAVASGARAPGLELRLDGRAFTPSTWNVPLPIDLGAHVLVASAARYLPWTHRFSVTEERSLTRIQIPALELAPVPYEELDWYQKPLGWVFGGVAVASAVAGVVFLLASLDSEDRANQPGVDLSDRDSLLEDADTQRLVFFIGAGATAASSAAATLVWTGVF